MSARAIDRLQLVVGGAVGATAWLLGYVLTYVIVAPDVRDSPLHRFVEAFEGEPATYEMVGWVFFNAHLVDTVFQDLPLVGTRTATFIGGEEGFTVALYVVPAGLLLATGIALARYHRATTPTEGVLAGLPAVPAYLLLSVVGALAFEVTVAGATGAPDLLSAVVFAGIVYPLTFVVIGGVLATLLAEEQPTETGTGPAS